MSHHSISTLLTMLLQGSTAADNMTPLTRAERLIPCVMAFAAGDITVTNALAKSERLTGDEWQRRSMALVDKIDEAFVAQGGSLRVTLLRFITLCCLLTGMPDDPEPLGVTDDQYRALSGGHGVMQNTIARGIIEQLLSGRTLASIEEGYGLVGRITGHVEHLLTSQ